ncbi:hypothetical protein FHX42_001541 [Saccharopolyspora lacisalsi]|uniref:Uncharacterized protein n=1 Tax=Halosaccharopolyspora lacisalsi TaxID=1000566 RepID=A0A839DQE7_9PSEU|nr:hypothetical protein [Halosaccharopolyspora lacisalsi]MBA8824212.1 hypothetical protein [Halosaccharopolyspora lacisalsi]
MLADRLLVDPEAWFDAERRSLRAAAGQCASLGLHERAQALSRLAAAGNRPGELQVLSSLAAADRPVYRGTGQE